MYVNYSRKLLMSKCEWIEMTDVRDLGMSLIDKYPNQFGHILIDRMKLIGLTNAKPPREGAKIWNFISIQTPVHELIGIDIVGLVHFDSWSNLDDKARALIIASMLSCIEWKDRLTVKGYDLHDSKNMIINFGVDYENNPESPDILNTNYNWRSV